MNVELHVDSESPRHRLRPADEVARLARMGAAFPTRLSFMRILIRKLGAENTQVTRPVWEINAQGFGRAVYSVQLEGRTYSLVAFSTPLEREHRTDRVIAESWDTSYALFDGVPSTDDLDRLEENVPKQEAGRFEPTELTLSRANKSVRLFEHVVEQLSKGCQPDTEMITSVGYLMRTTAVYGNGKFGIADRVRFTDRPALAKPFQAEMLTVWLIRGFTHDLVEHIARARSPQTFIPLSREVKKDLGIGNSTGLGMAPFLVKHAVLLNNWMTARETALARVCAIDHAELSTVDRICELITRARQHVDQWNVEDQRQMNRIKVLRTELCKLQKLATPNWLELPAPWRRLVDVSSNWSIECQELIAAMVLEPHGELIDELGGHMADNIGMRLDPAMSVEELSDLLRDNYQWALEIDFEQPDESSLFWYTSEEKLEPRLGIRSKDAGVELELPIDIARQAKSLHKTLINIDPNQTVALFLEAYPEHRHITRRVQTSNEHPYSEIRDNLIASDCVPLDILRFKLSFFGASKCDPKSSLWTRINMYQGAPLFDEICDNNVDDWWLPVQETST